MITTTIGAIVAAEAPLKKLLSVQLPVRAAYAVKRLADALTKDLEFYHSQREQMFKEWGSPMNGHVEMMEIKPAHMEEFQARSLAIMEQATEVDVKPLDLAMMDGLSLSAVELSLLGPFVTMSDNA